MPEHDRYEIENTAGRLHSFSYQVPVTCTAEDFLGLDKAGLAAEMERIAAMPVEQLEESATFVENWAGRPDEAGLDSNRVRRMEHILKEYAFLLRLRSFEPEAWDRIYELYYDD